MNQSEWSSSLLRWVGYGLLALAVFDFVDILLPPQLMNPTWEFQTVGALVERVPVPLIGLVLVFYAGTNSQGKVAKASLKFLSWAALVVGVCYLLLIPLALGNTWRINTQNNAQVIAQTNQQLAQIQQTKSQLSKATPQELNTLLQRVNRQSPAADIASSGELKKQLASQIAQAEQSLKARSASAQANTRLSLIKNSVKWNLGALVSGVLFIHIWHSTRWTRRKPSKRAQTAVPST